MKKSTLVLLILFFVLLADQALKIWVKTHLEYGDEIKMLGLEWALIHFVENPGMAFGWEIGGSYGKLILSIFRLLAVGFLVYFLHKLVKTDAQKGLLISFALILAGALGNIIDSAFYGLIFSESPYHGGLAELFPANGGYAGFLHGRVVDMFYFPVYRGTLPDWLPFWGGDYMVFFRPVFNIADVSITAGVLCILIFQRQFFVSRQEKTDQSDTNDTTTPEGSASAPSAIDQEEE